MWVKHKHVTWTFVTLDSVFFKQNGILTKFDSERYELQGIRKISHIVIHALWNVKIVLTLKRLGGLYLCIAAPPPKKKALEWIFEVQYMIIT